MTPIPNSTLILTNVREAIGKENAAGAEAVFEYTCEETSRVVKIMASGRLKEADQCQWIDLSQANLPEDLQELIFNNHQAFESWVESGLKYCRQAHCVSGA